MHTVHRSLSCSAQTAAYIHQGEGDEGYRERYRNAAYIARVRCTRDIDRYREIYINDAYCTSLSCSAQTAAYMHQGEGDEGYRERYRDDAYIALDIDTDTYIYR